MARYQVLYWKRVPSLVRSEDAEGEVQVPMGERFDQLIDARAMQEGLTWTDDYRAQLDGGEELERPDSAAEVAEAVKKELGAQHPPN